MGVEGKQESPSIYGSQKNLSLHTKKKDSLAQNVQGQKNSRNWGSSNISKQGI